MTKKSDNEKTNHLFQVSVACAMEIGVFDGACDYHTIMQKGDTGLGTFEHFDGEMVAVAGSYYQIKADGSVHLVKENQLAPFAQVTHFQPNRFFDLNNVIGFKKLSETLESKFENKNVPYVISIESICTTLKIRSVCKKHKPYPNIVDSLKDQVVFDLTNSEGTMVGFWFPHYLTTTSAPGLHLHYMTKDRQLGGHVLDLSLGIGKVSIAAITQIDMMLPETKPFAEANLKVSNMDMSYLQRIAMSSQSES